MILYFVVVMIIPLMMIFFGNLWRNNAPKSINWIYGYRTTRSMKSQEAWDFAHKYFGRLWFKVGVVLSIISIVLLFRLKGNSDEIIENIVVVLTVIQIIFLIMPIILTEISLKKNFDNNGKPRG